MGVSLLLQGFDYGKWQQISSHAVMQAGMVPLTFNIHGEEVDKVNRK